MFDPNRPYRSMLFSPASNARALAKIAGLACDGVILDLEDAVGDAQKEQARANLAGFSVETCGNKTVLVRLNTLPSECISDDAAAAVGVGVDGVVLPKVERPDDLGQLCAALDGLGASDMPVWAMIETPLGVMNVREIAQATPRLAGLILGPNDLAKALGAQRTPDRLALQASMGALVLAARAFGLVCLDGVYNAFRDDEGFVAECRQGRVLGFDGKPLIHPNQIAGANAGFAPSEAELELAGRRISAFEAAQAAGLGLVVVDGEMVEELHIKTAQSLLEKHRIIKEME